MPKKHRNYARNALKNYQSAPHSVSLSPSASSPSPPPRSVNQLLDNLRRNQPGGLPSTSVPTAVVPNPTLPPALRHLLQVPESPFSVPRARPRYDANGRRVPAGPPPPHSWLTPGGSTAGDVENAGTTTLRSSRVESLEAAATALMEDRLALPGTYHPSRSSLVATALRCMARDWEYQSHINRFYLYSLPSRLRSSLARHVSLASRDGLTVQDLRLLFFPPSVKELQEWGAVDGVGQLTAATNDDVVHLDLSRSLGRSVRLKEFGDFLFPSREQSSSSELEPSHEPQDSWDAAPTPTPSTSSSPSPSLPLFPNLTHLSLSIVPFVTSYDQVVPERAPSWKQLLALAPRLSALTHLCLAFWPEPTLTPRSKLSSVVPPTSVGGAALAVQLGGTGPYSHTVDDDYGEAVTLMRKLSRELYRLEFLDLTGCASWSFEALVRADAAGNTVNWATDWGKVTVVRDLGQSVYGEIDEAWKVDPAKTQQRRRQPKVLERHVISQRKGKGTVTPFSVEVDVLGGDWA